MKNLTMLVLCLGAFGGLLPIALYFGDEVLSSQEPPGMQHLTLSDWLRENQRTSQLNADAPILFHLNDASTKIIAELIEGRLSLRDAAEALRAVRESKPAHLCTKDRPPQQSVEEYFVRRALRGAELDLKDDPRRDAILARLQAELDDYLYAQAARP